MSEKLTNLSQSIEQTLKRLNTFENIEPNEEILDL